MPNGDALPGRTDFSRHRGPVTSVAPIPGRAAAVTTAYDGAVAMFDLAAKTVDLLGYHRHLGNHVAVDSRGAFAASSSSDYDIFIWDLKLRSVRRVLRGHSDDVECFTFADDATGVSASRDRRIIVWDLATGAIRKVIERENPYWRVAQKRFGETDFFAGPEIANSESAARIVKPMNRSPPTHWPEPQSFSRLCVNPHPGTADPDPR